MSPPKGMSHADVRARRAERLSDPELKRWFENIARGSITTAEQYYRSLFAFCDPMGVSPKALLKLGDAKLHALMLDFVSREQQRGQAGQTTKNHVKATVSWLAHNGIKVSRPVKIHGTQDTPTLRDERTPAPEELHRILTACTARDRVSAVLMAHAGVRPEVLGNYEGTDGLRLRDFPDLEIKGKTIRFTKTPAMVVVRPELSKAGHRYFTFIGEEACDYICAYLQERAQRFEDLTPDTDLIHARNVDKPFVRTTNVGDGIRAGIRAVMGDQVKMRPYALRAYFDTQLLLAESRGKVAHDYRVFWMGHKGSMEARYTTNKGRLPPAMIEDMREAYARCSSFLSTVPTKASSDAQANATKVLLMGLGYTEEELASLDLGNLDVSKLQDLVAQKVKIRASAERPKQKVVGADDLPTYLDQGWTAVMTLGGDRVVLNPPGN